MIHYFRVLFILSFLVILTWKSTTVHSIADCDRTSNHLSKSLKLQVNQRAVDWHPAENLLAVVDDIDPTIKLIQSDDGAEFMNFSASVGPELIRISPNGNLLANLGGAAFDLIYLDNGEHEYLLDFSTIDPTESHFGLSTSITWNSHSSKVSFNNDYKLYVLDIETLELKILRSEEVLDGFSLLIARWQPDGDYLAVYDGFATILFLDADTFEVSDQISWELPSRGLPYWFAYQGMDWSPDGTQIAVTEADTSGYSILIWDQMSKKLLGELPGCDGVISGFVWSPDGTMLAVAYGDDLLGPKPEDAFIRIWDAETYELVGITEPHEVDFVELDWSPNSQEIVGLDDDGMLYTWKIKSKAITDE